MKRHNNNFEEIITELKRQVPLLQKDELNSQDLIQYMKGAIVNGLNPEDTMKDIILLHYWCGNEEQALKELEDSIKIISKWEERLTKDFGGVDAWEKQVRNLMNRDILTNNIDKQLNKFGLEKLKDYGLGIG